MKLNVLEKELKQWGELILTTAEDHVFEIHLGDDVNFDTENDVLHIKTPQATYMIDADSIEYVTKHYAHKEQ